MGLRLGVASGDRGLHVARRILGRCVADPFLGRRAVVVAPSCRGVWLGVGVGCRFVLRLPPQIPSPLWLMCWVPCGR